MVAKVDLNSMKHAVFFLIATFILSFSSSALAAPKALVYNGAGACAENCAKAAYDIAAKAGFDPVYVGDDESDPKIFDSAAVWIQPGGHASLAMTSMADALKTNLKNFINQGGGYVGFCAGAFVATEMVGNTKVNGLGIIPGNTTLFGSGVDLKKFTWNGSERYLYWEGGPYFSNMPSSVEQIGAYPDGSSATVRTSYGKGRVYITGAHPEAPQQWKDYNRLNDPDGDDSDLVVQMLSWVTESH